MVQKQLNPKIIITIQNVFTLSLLLCDFAIVWIHVYHLIHTHTHTHIITKQRHWKINQCIKKIYRGLKSIPQSNCVRFHTSLQSSTCGKFTVNRLALEKNTAPSWKHQTPAAVFRLISLSNFPSLMDSSAPPQAPPWMSSLIQSPCHSSWLRC